MNVFQKIKKIDILIYYEDLYISIIYIEMNYNYYNIFNDIHKLQQQIIEHDNKIDELKEHYENKINEIKNQEQTYILEPVVKTSNFIQPNEFNYYDELNYVFRQNESLRFDYNKNNINNTIGRFKTEPLTLTIKNNTGHLFGFIQGDAYYVIPSHIKTNSIEPRLLYKESPRSNISNRKCYNVILWNGMVRLYINGNEQYECMYNKGYSSSYLTVNIHFNL